MIRPGLCLNAAVLLSAVLFLPPACSQDAQPQVARILLVIDSGAETSLAPTSEQVRVARSQEAASPGIVVNIQPGKGSYPGINIKPQGAPWNLSAFGHVAAHVVNTGPKPLSVSLRVDNAGDWKDNPWNTETISLGPGQSGQVTTVFGYAYGLKPGYTLKPAAIVNIMLFVAGTVQAQSFRLESLVAGGPKGEKPPIAPDDTRIKPANGFLLGSSVTINPPMQIIPHGAEAMLSSTGSPKSLRVVFPVVFPATGGEQSLSFKPALGRWDLRDYLAVRVKVRNGGQTPVVPRVRLDSNGGTSEWVNAAPLAPGATAEITLPFAATAPADLGRKDTGSRITSDAVSAVTISAEKSDAERVLLIESIQAVTIIEAPPVWLGHRPPVEGEWVKTLDDEFNRSALDTSIWSIYGDNYWDKQTHWSKEDVFIGGGRVKLRYEKKRGFNNDDPTQPQTAYAAGYLHTYNKWAQRYGYFEARMKLPTAPGLWPAFWMMPDRGKAAGPEQWKRQDTGAGAMEFDIMEHLTRWGPHRYNIAMQYDGYGKDHKSLGSDKIYVQPDKEGFLTCGLLWTPGSVVYYCNGKEVLRWKDVRISNVPSILMFTLPMGGWDNSILTDSQLPADFIIDYVRVWQRKDLASSTDGKEPAF